MANSTAIWSVVIGILSFIWLLYSRLYRTSVALEDDLEFEGTQDLKQILNDIQPKDIQDLPETNAIWNVGITAKAASVTDDTQLRVMEFRSETKVDAEYIEALLLKAIMEPVVLIEEAGGVFKEGFSIRPSVVLVSEVKFVTSKIFDELVERMKKYNVKVSTKDIMGSDLENMLSKRKTELFKQQQEAQKKIAESSKDAQIEWSPPPNRGCFQCHEEINGKVQQCSACKAVIYCSSECATKDWQMHKQICTLFKADVDRIASDKLHSFPFTYYPENKPFGNYNTVNMLIKHGIHNVGVFRRLCICYQNVPMGDLYCETLQSFEAANVMDPKDKFNATGLQEAWYPLSAPLKNSRKIKNWKDLFEAKKVPFDDIAPFVLDHPLTIWHFLDTHILDNVETGKDGRKAITLHYLGVEAECDFLAVFEILLALLPPKTDLAIHMIGPSASTAIPPKYRYFTYKSAETDSNLVLTLTTSLYTEALYSGQNISRDFPKLDFGKGTPTAVIILNGLLLGYETWIQSIQMMISKKAKIFCTEGMEQNAASVGRNLLQLNHGLRVPVAPNPFRQPVFQFKKDANLPAWSNGFLFGF